jgi:hypothetical protein
VNRFLQTRLYERDGRFRDRVSEYASMADRRRAPAPTGWDYERGHAYAEFRVPESEVPRAMALLRGAPPSREPVGECTTRCLCDVAESDSERRSTAPWGRAHPPPAQARPLMTP